MSLGLKTLGIIFAGTIMVLSLFDSETTSTAVSGSSRAAPLDITETKSESRPAAVVSVSESAEVAPSKPAVIETKAAPKPAPKPVSNCHPNYSGCLKMGAGDYDCAGGSGNGPNYTGTVRVYGADPFGLDRDNDGWGCE